ncbi:Helix-turn-helix domain protein [compost metagenome]
MNKDLYYKFVNPDKSLDDFVERFWLLQNQTNNGKEIVVLPDGRIDLFFAQSATEPFHITLSGLETYPDQVVLAAGTTMFSISFKLLATEYIFHSTVSNILNYAKHFPADFWDFNANDMNNFELFCEKASQKIQSLLPKEIDNRKQKLFDLIYSSNGAVTVKEISEKVFWSSRQINRYFNQQYGLSLKAYCGILRFRASLEHIAQGKLYPEQNFTDQNHFIKDIKKYSGVLPKELLKNKNDRFVLLSSLKSK